MAQLPADARNICIALGILTGVVIDARKRFGPIIRVNQQLEDDCA
jgi:hypothetical protein